MGPSYSEALSSEIDGAVKAISDEPLGSGELGHGALKVVVV